MKKVFLQVGNTYTESKKYIAIAVKNNRDIRKDNVVVISGLMTAKGYCNSFPITYITGTRAEKDAIEYKYVKSIHRDKKGKVVYEFYTTPPVEAKPENTISYSRWTAQNLCCVA